MTNRNAVDDIWDFFQWKNPLITGVVFGAIQMFFWCMIFDDYSFFALVALGGIFFLFTSMLIAHGSIVLYGYDSGEPNENEDYEFISREAFEDTLSYLYEVSNNFAVLLNDIIQLKDFTGLIALGTLFIGLSILGELFSDLILCWVITSILFLVPLFLSRNKELVSHSMEIGTVKFKENFSKIQAMIPKHTDSAKKRAKTE
eukprot:CAMPEP_0115018036 /NCGR_PEP_ID=MMETSP0216-20121206/28524_1 /TAXON_ID=223996 /ORGANISM="Protocruzia adherens, Strain Boccale" /LENGTH=200 /DNA_ID=CAMNT_0002389069 /DNA_START=188 /DNA_END=790 /DNA_ORIENTATION=+